MMAIAWMSLWLFFHHDEAFLGKIRSFSLYRWRIVFLILYLLLNGNFLALLHDLKIAPAYLKEQKGREVLVMQRKNEGIKDVLILILNNKPSLSLALCSLSDPRKLSRLAVKTSQ